MCSVYARFDCISAPWRFGLDRFDCISVPWRFGLDRFDCISVPWRFGLDRFVSSVINLTLFKVTPYTWTHLANTANAGDTSITLMHSVNWEVGNMIVIPTTGHRHSQSETETR
jgi:hypothetical protein